MRLSDDFMPTAAIAISKATASIAVTPYSVTYDGNDIMDLDPEERAREGIFLAFQYPVEIPGVANTYFLKAALNAVRRHRGEEELDAFDFKDPLPGARPAGSSGAG